MSTQPKFQSNRTANTDFINYRFLRTEEPNTVLKIEILYLYSWFEPTTKISVQSGWKHQFSLNTVFSEPNKVIKNEILDV